MCFEAPGGSDAVGGEPLGYVMWSLKSFLAVRGSVPYQLADLEQGTLLSPSFFIV